MLCSGGWRLPLWEGGALWSCSWPSSAGDRALPGTVVATGSELMACGDMSQWQQEDKMMIQQREMPSRGKESRCPANTFYLAEECLKKTEPTFRMRWFCRTVKMYNFFKKRKAALIPGPRAGRVLWWAHSCWFAEPCGPSFPQCLSLLMVSLAFPRGEIFVSTDVPKRGDKHTVTPDLNSGNSLAGKTCCHQFWDVGFPSSYLPHLFDWRLVLLWVLKTKKKWNKIFSVSSFGIHPITRIRE